MKAYVYDTQEGRLYPVELPDEPYRHRHDLHTRWVLLLDPPDVYKAAGDAIDFVCWASRLAGAMIWEVNDSTGNPAQFGRDTGLGRRFIEAAEAYLEIGEMRQARQVNLDLNRPPGMAYSSPIKVRR